MTVKAPRGRSGFAQRLEEALDVVQCAQDRARNEQMHSTFWAKGNPDVKKYLDRLYDALDELSRLYGEGRLPPPAVKRADDLLLRVPSRLQAPEAESSLALLWEFQMLLIDHGDVHVICGMVEEELHWHKGETSWLTWDGLYGDSTCEAVEQYRKGKVSKRRLRSARHRLESLYRARRDDQQARLCRAEVRRKTLDVLTGVLIVVLPPFLILYHYALHPHPNWALTFAVPLAGAVGAAVSGTYKARDQLVRESDIAHFSAGLLAQLLVGAAAALLVVVLLRAKLTSFGDLSLNKAVEQIAFGFVAGFSEPFVLGTVQRVTQSAAAKPQ